MRRGRGDPESDRHHRQGEEFARAGADDAFEQERQHTAADCKNQRHEHHHATDRHRQFRPKIASRRVRAGRRDRPNRDRPERTGKRGQHDQRQNRQNILDHEPGDGDPPGGRFDDAQRFQRLQQHDGAGDRQAEAEDEPGAETPAPQLGESERDQGRDRDLADRARNDDAPLAEQVADRDVHTNAEHQQDDADFGELRRQAHIGDVAWRERSDDDAGGEIAEQRRQPDPRRDEPEDERPAEAEGDRLDQRYVMRQVASPVP